MSKEIQPRGFTLIERVPRVTHAQTRWLQRTTPVNCSLQTGSLTAEHTGARSAVTKSREGKSLLGLPGSRGGLRVSPSGEAKTQAVGKRTSASIVKVNWQALLTEPASLGSRSPVRWEKVAIIEVASGQTHSMTRRCKRRRHGSRVRRSNWGGPARFWTNRGKTKQRVDPLPQPRAITATSPWRSGTSRCHRISDGTRRNAERRGDAVLGVGDAHSSEDHGGSKTLWERRGISRSVFPTGGVDRA